MEKALEPIFLHIKGEGAILADDSGDRPLPRYEVTPARGPPRDGNGGDPRAAERPQRRISLLGEQAVFRDRVVYVEEDVAYAFRDCPGHVDDRESAPHRGELSLRYWTK